LQEAFLKKYPGICPYCLEQQCICYKTGKVPRKPISCMEMKQEMTFKYESIKKILQRHLILDAARKKM